MTRNELFEYLDEITNGMGAGELLIIIRDFANYLSTAELQEFLSLNGYLDDSEDLADDTTEDEPEDAPEDDAIPHNDKGL